ISALDATVDIVSAGVAEGAGSILAADKLRLQGAGSFTLTQANQIDKTLAAVTSGGTFSYTDADSVTVGTVLGTDGINTGGQNLTLTTVGLLTLGDGGSDNLTAVGRTIDLPAAGVSEAGA